MLKEVIRFFEAITAGMYELAPVYICVESNRYPNK